MKSHLALLSILLFTSSLQAFDHGLFDKVLKRHVDSSGQVAYASLLADRTDLDLYLQKTGSVPQATFDSWNEAEQLAFLINIYNAETLQFIIDNYPTKSIKKLGGLLSSPWKKDVVVLFGKKESLDHVEHELIRVDFASEPRIHFALVCAAKGCPPLRNEAFVASRLDAQLEEQTRTFLTDTKKNRVVSDKLFLSPIFDWYGGDFTKNGRTLNDYVAPYLPGDPAGKPIEFTFYDWNLNEQ